jgi:hypothetical protein
MMNVATDYTTLEFAVKEALSTALGGAQPSRGGGY